MREGTGLDSREEELDSFQGGRDLSAELAAIKPTPRTESGRLENQVTRGMDGGAMPGTVEDLSAQLLAVEPTAGSEGRRGGSDLEVKERDGAHEAPMDLPAELAAIKPERPGVVEEARRRVEDVAGGQPVQEVAPLPETAGAAVVGLEAGQGPRAAYERQNAALAAAVERCPPGANFEVKLHRGSSVKLPREQEQQRLVGYEKRLKAAWMIVAEGFGLDPQQFPIDRVDFWAPKNPDPKGPIGKVRNMIYGRREWVRHLHGDKAANASGGTYSPAYGPLPPKLNMPLREDGKLNMQSLTHETAHAALDKVGAFVNPASADQAGTFFNEGLGRAAERMFVDAIGAPERPLLGNIFDNLRNEIEGVDVSQKTRLADLSYGSANGWLHRYLVEEEGGVDKLREVAAVNRKPNEEQLKKAYEQVYGASLAELVERTKAWYLARNRSGGAREIRRAA